MEMTSSKRADKSTLEPMWNCTAGTAQNSPTELLRESTQPIDTYLTGTSFAFSTQGKDPSGSAEAPLSVLVTVPDELESSNAFAAYPSGNPPDTACPTLADAVIEHLRLARLRRQRPH